MAKKDERERMNLTLPPALGKKLRTYLVARANKKENVEHDIKARIGRAAIEEWLDKHGKDFDISLP